MISLVRGTADEITVAMEQLGGEETDGNDEDWDAAED
jgi:hypothetical protein